ncbi:espin-like protein [Chanos chanos]|uniref:Espin-like protein n=1 Tax=Chanos chanos TaxID=29144 RepID=A0A6J2VH20_CHACN|nr:espin-like protein [Chanos chanos]
MGLHRAIQAAHEGDLTTLRALHSAGCLSSAISDAQGASPAHHAARCGHLDCLRFLVGEVGLSGHARAWNGATPVHDAAATGHLEELQWLLGHGGCNIEDRDGAGATVLHLAAQFGHAEVMQWLLSIRGGTGVETDSGALPIHYAAANGHLTCVKLLVSHFPGCMDHQTYTGATPLYLACQGGHLHVVEYLVRDCGADVHQRALDGMSALHAAAHMGHHALVVWLASFTDMDLSCQDTDGATPMHFAASEGHHRILERLLLMGAKVVKDHCGGTPLHDAAENGELECCRVLLTNQINPLEQDIDGFSAADLAENNGHHDCAKYLRAAASLQHSEANPLQAVTPLEGEKGCTETTIHHQALKNQNENKNLQNRMENSKPVKEVPPQPRLSLPYPDSASTGLPSTHSGRAAANTIQHVQVASTVVTSFNMMKPIEEEKSLLAQMKTVRSMKHAGITAVFTGQTGLQKGEHEMVLLPLEEANLIDIDSLVPTHDENGHPIAEWKRQVMVRKLQARLQDEEDERQKEKYNKYAEVDGWRYSQVHNAILGPFGELLTEDDLVYLEEQIENASLQKRCQAYELELARLAEELRAILPAPVVDITVNTQLQQQSDTEGPLPLPVWYNRISSIVKSMSQLLNNLGNKEDVEGICKMPNSDLACVFTHQPERQSSVRERREKVEKEIQESGVCVKSLRSNFESQIETIYPFSGLVNSRPQNDTNKQAICSSANGKQSLGLTIQGSAVNSNSDTSTRCKQANNKETVKVMETTTLRKERIVVLFLSHWKKSAYAISLRAKMKQGLSLQNSSENNHKVEGTNVSYSQNSHFSLYHLYKQRTAIDKMIGNWRHIVTGLTSRQIQRLHRKRVIYSPEQFLPRVDGVPVDYDSLTLDLFMLGYFHILEQDLPAEERKMRHLLCFEVFDHVGSFPWETVRDFHRAVLRDIEAGRREWRDGFEDIKAQYFGTKGHFVSGGSSVDSSVEMTVPRVIVESATPDEGVSLRKSDFSCFSNEEICKYIDRSFAFWKEKEAEMFDFGH